MASKRAAKKAVKPMTEAQIAAYAEKEAKAADKAAKVEAEAVQDAAEAKNAAEVKEAKEAQAQAARDVAAVEAEAAKTRVPLVPPASVPALREHALHHQVVKSMTDSPSLVLFSDGRQGLVLDEEGHLPALNTYSAADVLYLAVRVVYVPPPPKEH